MRGSLSKENKIKCNECKQRVSSQRQSILNLNEADMNLTETPNRTGIRLKSVDWKFL